MTTEREWIMDNAAEHVVVLFDHETGAQSCLAIVDGDNVVLDEIDKHYALGLAARLVELAIELPDTRVKLPSATLTPDKRRPIRRLAAVDEQLREIDE
ncbi:hypothetical protein [Microbacterium hydrocarbonoxydans]|uniref:hypothetical protein n=1 Tax=Microbacterium hydrocarbonoxydans TaxID=273678 RepID=UPI00203BD189|nr:hypothetical protein [Microbacterium hydrocarbonoxydans]MCM3779874.1 hypothetical protein [Microbacterium hydrocarbonoxydans]